MSRRTVSAVIIAILLTGILMAAFNVQPAKSDYAFTQTIYIRADGSWSPSTAPISSIDNVTYKLTDNIVGNVTWSSSERASGITIQRDNIIMDGAGYTLQSTNPAQIGGIGIYLPGRNNVTIKNMKIMSFAAGIWINASSSFPYTSSSHISLSGNFIVNNMWGISGGSADDNISGNIVKANEIGLLLQSFSNDSINGNTITANTWAGIQLNYYSSNNNVSGNNIASNEYGIYLYYCSSNRIFHNSFVNNNAQVYSNGSVNAWDDGYPSGGNYWSDYNGKDLYHDPNHGTLGSDGIGDTPYVIDGNNVDNYPLMGPFSSLYSGGTQASISCVSNSTISNFQVAQKTISFDVSGPQGTAGFCMLTIPYSILPIPPIPTVKVDGNKIPSPPQIIFQNDKISTTIYFTYPHSTHEVTISSVDWWPMFHHDLTHVGYSTSTGPDTNQTLWNARAGGGVGSSPAVFGGVVYVGSGDHKVYALDAVTGAQVWNYTTGNWVESSPAVASGLVYVGSDDQKVYALNAATGAQVWNYTTGGGVYSSPVVVGGVVYVGSGDGKVYALDAVSGGFIWSYPTGSSVYSSPAVVAGVVYVGSGDGKVYALNATTSAFIWSYATGGSVYSSPAVVGGLVYVGSDDGKVYALNATTGVFIWSYATGGSVYSSPAVVGGLVYVGSDDGKVYALNATTGVFIWSYATGNWVESSPAVAGGVVYVGSDDQKVYALDAATGAQVWNYATGGGVWSSPAVAGGVVYVCSEDVYAFGFAHDVAVTDVACSKTVVCQGFSASINVTVANQGIYTEPFNVTAYANATAIQTETLTLTSQDSTTLTFTWSTTGFAKGNYTLSAYAWPVPGETDTSDNNFTGGWVVVSMVGDLTGAPGHSIWDFVPDRSVDGSDLIVAAMCFGSWPGAPPPYRWNANCDITNDGSIDGSDLIMIARHFGQTSP